MIDAIKQIATSVDISDVARYLGLDVNRAGYICCPLHLEKTPSCKLYDDGMFHCFGCGAHGDSIDLVSAVRGCSKAKAAAELNEHFSLSIDLKKPTTAIRRRVVKRDEGYLSEEIKQIYGHLSDLHRHLLHQGVRLESLEQNLSDFLDRLLEDDNLRVSAPEIFFRKHRKEFIQYADAERKYYAIRNANEQSRRNGQPYPWREILSIMGRNDSV